jgi:hypothetical protein
VIEEFEESLGSMTGQCEVRRTTFLKVFFCGSWREACLNLTHTLDDFLNRGCEPTKKFSNLGTWKGEVNVLETRTSLFLRDAEERAREMEGERRPEVSTVQGCILSLNICVLSCQG